MRNYRPLAWADRAILFAIAFCLTTAFYPVLQTNGLAVGWPW